MTDVAQGIAFYGLAGITVIAALLVVSLRNIFHAVLALVVSFAGVSGLYITLSAGFLAAVQILIYLGAIAVLTLFAVFMTRNAMSQGNPPGRLQGPALIAAALVFVTMAYVFLRTNWESGEGTGAGPEVLAAALFTTYALPFELASVLLLIAMIGAIALAREPGPPVGGNAGSDDRRS